MAGDLVLIILEVKLIVIRQLKQIERRIQRIILGNSTESTAK